MLEKGAVKIEIAGEKLRGGFALVRTRFGGKKNNWLLIKEKDAHARPGSDVTAEAPRSVLSGRDVDEVRRCGEDAGDCGPGPEGAGAGDNQEVR